MLKNIIGAIIKLAFAITFIEYLLQIILVTMKNSVIYKIGEVLKYIVLKVSDKLFIIDAVRIISKKIYAVPIINLRNFPPRNWLMSKMS